MSGTLKVMSTLAVELALKSEILPRWAAQGHDIQVFWSPTGVLLEKIKGGARSDVVIAIDQPIEDLAGQGILAAASIRPVAQAGFGIAALKGCHLPDIASADKFKAALIEAKSIVYSRTGASGIHFLKVLDQLGIAAQMQPKLLEIPSGFTAEKVVSGDAEIAVQQISELMAIEGVDVIGPFPGDLQKLTDFSAAVFCESTNQEAARSFIDLVTDTVSAGAYARCGLSARKSQIAA